ncbi:hypothetical protein THRCLA_01422 [Thraustotheca clavata]|uniref:Prolyl 4-hydroxylase alpha subunit domain-containing protein n=1 Tax=Thraustotheca clavata TaxID=74557 RepID=A0A1W0A941_9STRA|nr:hypothetical protein THRCLA_01422 [Thraustotheca clavata]
MKPTEPEPEEKETSPVKENKSIPPSSGNKLVLYLLPVLLAILAGYYTLQGDNDVVNTSPKRQLAVDMVAPLLPKYESEVVRIEPRQLLEPSPACTTPEFKAEGVHVLEAVENIQKFRDEKSVLLLLNGENEGVVYSWEVAQDCLYELTKAAALRLNGDPDYIANGIRLLNSDGKPITTAQELDTERVAYILFDFQLWVWSGVKVGYERNVDGIHMKTLSLSPIVFGIENFFTSDEADFAIDQGLESLGRSPVDSKEAPDGYHSDRTSFTAFLPDSAYTRDFRARTAKLARLPSPGYCERMQLLRYQTGQFFRKHEDYFSSKSFLEEKSTTLDEYIAWTKWASATIESLGDKVPTQFRKGQIMHPNFEDRTQWQHALLSAFLEDAAITHYFEEHAAVEWGTWIKENVDNRATGVLDQLVESKSYMFKDIVHAWEKRVQLEELNYSFPKKAPSAVSHYFRWIRWAKERVEIVGDKAPENIRTNGDDYPTYRMQFQTKLIEFVMTDNTKEEIEAKLGNGVYERLNDNKHVNDGLIQILRDVPALFDAVLASWTKRAGDQFIYSKPVQFQHFEPNRFVTLFLYLNDVPEGGETVFPYSKERLVVDITREGMEECSEGLAVPAKRLKAAFFYDQTGQNVLDPLSLHGGCPPARGDKFGANLFTWNVDADEGSNAWGFGG